MQVYVLWHVHELAPGESDEMLIGIFETEGSARDAIAKLSHQPGFSECPEGFLVDPYVLGRIHWEEGFTIVD